MGSVETPGADAARLALPRYAEPNPPKLPALMRMEIPTFPTVGAPEGETLAAQTGLAGVPRSRAPLKKIRNVELFPSVFMALFFHYIDSRSSSYGSKVPGRP